MSDEARELHRRISDSVRDMLSAYRIQAQAGPGDRAGPRADRVPGRASDRAEPAPYPAEQRAALLPNVVRLLLAAFLEAVAGAVSNHDPRRPKAR
jgi:hypothetical protein